MILDATNKSVTIKLNGTITTNQLPVIVNYTDYGIGNLPKTECFETDNTNDVTIVSSPGSEITRLIMLINIYNRDSVDATVNIKYVIDGNNFIWRKATLTSGSSLIYSRGIWYY